MHTQRFAPWDNNPYGVVSLHDMYEFNAREYVELAHQLGLLLGFVSKRVPDPNLTGKALRKLLAGSNQLGLTTTREHIWNMIAEIAKDNPDKVKLLPDRSGIVMDDAFIDTERMCHHIEAVCATLNAEIGSILFKAIARERNSYMSSVWLDGSPVSSSFPTSFKELDRAGVCYALGQSTAAVFHAMRALEPSLAALAEPFGVASTHDNWQNIINEIESKIRALGQQQKTQQKIDDEKFFGGAVSHLYFVKNAWRNHVAHTRDSYSDDEALKVIQHSKEFIESLCPRLKE